MRHHYAATFLLSASEGRSADKATLIGISQGVDIHGRQTRLKRTLTRVGFAAIHQPCAKPAFKPAMRKCGSILKARTQMSLNLIIPRRQQNVN